MKRVIIYLGCFALLLTGCNKIEMVEEPVVDSSDKLAIDIEINFDGDTRAVKGGWENQDAIYVVFDHYFSPNKDADTDNPFVMVLRYYDGAWEVESLPTALEMYLQKKVNKTGYLAAVYFSDYNDRRLPTTFSYRKLTEGDYLVPVGSISYTVSPTVLQQRAGFLMSDKSVQYTIEDGKLKASLNMKIDPNLVHFYIPGTENLDASGRKRFSFRCEQFGWQNLLRFESTYIAELGEIHEWYSNPFVRATVDYSTSIPAAVYPNGVRFCGYLRNEVKGIETEYVIVVTDNKGTPDDDSDDTIYTLKKTATLNGKEAIKLPELDSGRWEKRGKVNGHEWVEIAGAKWATINVGGDPDNYNALGTFFTWRAAQDLQDSEYWSWGEGWHVATRAEWMRIMGGMRNPTSASTPYPLSFERKYVQSQYSDEQFYYGMEVFPYNDPNAAKLFFPKGVGYKDEQNQSVAWDNGVGYYWADNGDGTSSVFELDPNVDFPLRLVSKDKPSDQCQMFIRLVAD